MGYSGDPYDNRGDGQIWKDAPTGDFTETPDEVADYLQDRA